MIALAAIAILATSLSAAPAAASTSRGVRITTSPVEGLGFESGVARRDPSDILRIGGKDYVFYTRVTPEAPLYPAKYAGEVWFASSQDGGHSWREEGRALGHGKDGAFDSLGVFEPNLVRAADGELFLFYSGIGPTFNFRFEGVRRVEPVRIGVARVQFDGGSLQTRRIPKAAPVLVPSERNARGFDSLRVTGAAPVLRNGIVHLYYEAFDLSQPSASSTLGLATALDPRQRFRRSHEGRSVLPFGGEALMAPHQGGVIALLTNVGRGLYWAADGEHFARMPIHVSGRLTKPGLWRSQEEGEGVAPWGLHVARETSHPYLERFEIQLPTELPSPLEATLAAPNARANPKWRRDSGWLDHHRASLELLAERPSGVLLLGDGLIEDLGGHDRTAGAAGADAWRELFADREAANLGFGGDRTQHILWRLAHGLLDQARVRCVVLAVGGNQVGDDSAPEVAAGVEAILQRVQHGLPRAEVVLLSALPARDPKRQAEVASLNREFARLGRRPRVRLLDLTARFGDEDGRLRSDLVHAEGEGLTSAGYRELASALDPVLLAIEELVPEGAEKRLQELGGED